MPKYIRSAKISRRASSLHRGVAPAAHPGMALPRTQMEVVNKSAETMKTTHALHAYYRVSDTDNVSVSDLGSAEYLDNADSRKSKSHPEAAARIDGVSLVDRIYKAHGARVRHDARRCVVLM